MYSYILKYLMQLRNGRMLGKARHAVVQFIC